jgi:hypothetical protein
MRVVMPILEYHPIVDGAQCQLAGLGPLLVRRGVEAHVLTRAVLGRPECESLDSLEVHRVETGPSHRLAGPRFVAAADRANHSLAADVAEDDRSGVLVEPGSPRAVAAALKGCLAEPERRLRPGQGASKTIRDGCFVKHAADRWVEKYIGLMDRTRPGRAGR